MQRGVLVGAFVLLTASCADSGTGGLSNGFQVLPPGTMGNGVGTAGTAAAGIGGRAGTGGVGSIGTAGTGSTVLAGRPGGTAGTGDVMMNAGTGASGIGAAGTGASGTGASGSGASGTGASGTGAPPVGEPVIPELTADCPEFRNGTITFMGLGGIQIVSGPKPALATAPMVFYWHGTGSFSGEFASICLLYTSPSPRDS